MSWLREMSRPPAGLRAKRALDLAASAGGLLVLSPVLGAVTVLQLAYHGWPPLFVQERPGLHGKTFRILKFRTMTDARDEQGRLLGDMSLVGPRPLLVRYLDRYTAEQMRRHDMPPGITGWAQINGRNALSWDAKFALDLEYIDRWSLALDARILLTTVKKVLVRDGISAEGEATMPEFMGSMQVEA